MELYHIHLLGNHDNDYKEKKTIVIDPEKFDNRLYKRIYNMNPTVSCEDFPNIMGRFNRLCAMNGFGGFKERVNIGEIMGFAATYGCSEQEFNQIYDKATEFALAQGINTRELAMEEYRKTNCPDKFSRLHSLYACDATGIQYWMEQIRDTNSEIFRIDVEDEPFHSSCDLLPNEDLSYGQKIEASRQYFHPRKKDLGTVYDEYLVQGRVLIKEKVGEIRIK